MSACHALVGQRPDCRSPRPNVVLGSRAVAACIVTILLGAESAAQSPRSAPSPGAAGIAWLILVDDLHMDFRHTGRIRDFLRSIPTGLMRDDDVVVMRASGPSSISIGPTSDRAIFDDASRRVSGNGLLSSEITDELKSQGEIEIDIRLVRTFSTASLLLDSVPAAPDRRLAMLYFTNGYDSERGRALASLFARAAQQAHVIVFTVNASAFRGSAPRVDGRVDAEVWKQVIASRRQSLRAIAEPTGGIAFLDDVDGAGVLSRTRAAVLAAR